MTHHNRTLGVFALLLVLVGSAAAETRAHAQGRRALVVGIDRYSPPPGSPGDLRHGRGQWPDLNGAVADAQAIRSVLVARYGFAVADVALLSDQGATREAILSGLGSLRDRSKAGDVALFYYAGHGSQVFNSRSSEPDQLDESLVPADSWRGVPDIRDKELARLYDQLLDRGANLVVISDSCHSGSISRGITGSPTTLRPRKIGASRIDAADPYVASSRADGVRPLVLSAAQDVQLAWEAYDPRGRPRGLFSYSLQSALQTVSPSEPVELLFRRVQSRMAASRDDQDPVVEGTAGRLRQPLFGATSSAREARTVVGVVGVDRNRATLGGGWDVGLTPGTELVVLDGRGGLRLRVDSIEGPGRSTATLTAGDPRTLVPGQLLAVDRWAASDLPPLRVFVPSPLGSAAEVVSAAQRAHTAAAAVGAQRVDDPLATPPSHVLFSEGGSWKLAGPAGVTVVGADPGLVGPALKEAGPKASLFVTLPPFRALSEPLAAGPGTASPGVVHSARDAADYHLSGRLRGGALEYAWVRPSGAPGGTATLPPVTRWLDAAALAATLDGLVERLNRLAWIYAWLELPGPPDSGEFPYTLAIVDAEAADPGRRFFVSGQVRPGHEYNLALVATQPVAGRRVKPRWVYVFAIDSAGKSSVIVPFPGQGDVENQFPPAHDAAPKSVYMLLSKDTAWVGPPFGNDTYLLLTTTTKLSSPGVLEGGGVRGGSGGRGPDPLSALLSGVGSGSRGVTTAPPSTWSIRRLTVQSVGR